MASPGGFRPNPNSPGTTKEYFEKLADARLAEFKCLAAGSHYVSAVYMAGYVVESLLKCAICKTLDTNELPKNFEMHNLDALLFLSGLEKKLSVLPKIERGFKELNNLWENAQLRYTDPSDPKFTKITCDTIEHFLTDPVDGVVPWLKRNI